MTYSRFYSIIFVLTLCGCSNADTDTNNGEQETKTVEPLTPTPLNQVPKPISVKKDESASSDDAAMNNESTSKKNNMLTVTGQVVYMELEGGFWGIIAEDGSKYVPQQGLTKEYQKNGLMVKAQLKPRPDMISFIMWGTQAELISIESDGTIKPVTIPGRRSEL